MVQLHDPEFIVVDLRNADKTECNRVWALLHNAAHCRCLAVVNPAELSHSSIPLELTTRIQVIVQATTRCRPPATGISCRARNVEFNNSTS